MSPREFLRALTPAGMGLAVVVAILVLLIVGRGLGLHWDPLGLTARRLEQAERQAEAAIAETHARTLEVEGAAAQTRRLEQQHQQAIGLARVTAAAEAQARTAHDSELPLDPDRAARLRAHDRELCRLASDVCGSAPAGPASGGADAVPAGPASGSADPG